MVGKQFLSQTELGRLFNMTSPKMGRALRSIGLRTPANRPSAWAFADDYVTPRDLPHGSQATSWGRVGRLVDLEYFGTGLSRATLSNRCGVC